MRCVPTGQTVNKEYYVEVLREFRKKFGRKRPALFKSGQWHFHQDNAPVHNSILITNYLTKMGINTIPHRLYSPDRAPCDFWLFPMAKEKLRGCRYETIEEMRVAVTKVIDTLTQEDFHGAFQNLLEHACNERSLLIGCRVNSSHHDKFQTNLRWMGITSLSLHSHRLDLSGLVFVLIDV